MKTEKFWKVELLKEYLLKLTKEDKLKCEVTRSEESDITTKIKLMQEAEEYGRTEATQEVIEDEINLLEFLDDDEKSKEPLPNWAKIAIKDELNKIKGCGTPLSNPFFVHLKCGEGGRLCSKCEAKEDEIKMQQRLKEKK